MEKFFTDFLTAISPALQTLIVALVTLLLGQASVYLNKQRQILNAKLTADQRFLLDLLAERAVQTVEQIYKNEPNVIKRDEAIALVEAGLEKAGLTVDLNVVVEAIEAQVFEKNQALPKG
jgi:LL-H family phage holin